MLFTGHNLRLGLILLLIAKLVQIYKSSDFVIEVTWYLTFDLMLYLFQKQASYLGWYLREVWQLGGQQ